MSSSPPSPSDVTRAWLAFPAPLHAAASPAWWTLAVTFARVPEGTDEELIELCLIDIASGAAPRVDAALADDHTASWSPTGDRLAFLTARTGSTQVAIAAIDNADAQVVTDMPAGVTGPVSWSPDGTRLAFAAPRGRQIDRTKPYRVTRAVQWADGIGPLDDPPQLWVHDLAAGISARLTDDEWRWSLPRWSPDGTTIAARASHDPAGPRRGQHLRLVHLDGSWTAPAVPGGFTVVPAWSSTGTLVVLSVKPEGRSIGSRGQLHTLDHSGVRHLTANAPFGVGGDVYGDSPAEIADSYEHALVVDGDTVYVRFHEGGRMGIASVRLDGEPVWHRLVTGDRCVSPLAVVRSAPAASEVGRLATSSPSGPTPAPGVAWQDGRQLVVAEQSAQHPCRLLVIDIGEQPSPTTAAQEPTAPGRSPAGARSEPAVSGGEPAAPLQDETAPGGSASAPRSVPTVLGEELTALPTDKAALGDDSTAAERANSGPVRVLGVPDAPPAREAAEVRRFRVPSPVDGAPLEAWFLAPPGTPAGPLPTAVIVHGGPMAAYGESFSFDAQVLCAAGFGVLYTNPHGSTGYGDAFTHSVIGDWGGAPVADVLAVIDAAVERGWVDGDRVGVAGNSYGGYLSAWLACTTTRFRAAVVENPATDLLSLYGTSDIGALFVPAQLGAGPPTMETVEPYLRWSPIMRAAECRTPILFVVGTDDRRCPPSQAFEMHRALHAVGTPSEVLVLPGATHEGSTYGPIPARLAHDDALVDWMNQWLRADRGSHSSPPRSTTGE